MSTVRSDLSDVTREPLVTIAIPTFNRASLLKNCVIAAFSQTYQHFEVVVSDNASTDETAEVLRQFSDARLRVVRQVRNIGLVPNWNACLAEAKGEYIVYCSDDDALAPRILERCVELAKRDPEIPIVVGLCDVYSTEDGRLHRATPSTKLATGIWDGTRILIEYLRININARYCSMMMRTEALRARGGFPLDLRINATDVAGWAPLLLKGRAGFVNETCATFCYHNANDSSKITFEAHLQAEREIANCIIKTAEGMVKDVRARCQVQFEARCFLARRIVFALAQHRKRGDKLTEVLPWIWHQRSEIVYVGAVNPLNFVKPIALVLFPKLFADQIRKLKAVYRQLISRAM
jgi:glycosyltransferase involved in cell wall biosynthesis